MLVGGVVEHEVEHHAQPAGVGLVDQALSVLKGPVLRRDVLVVGDVVAEVHLRTREERRHPHRLHRVAM